MAVMSTYKERVIGRDTAPVIVVHVQYFMCIYSTYMYVRVYTCMYVCVD